MDDVQLVSRGGAGAELFQPRNFSASGTAVRRRMISVIVSPWMYSMTM